MERLAFQRDQGEVNDPGARLLRRIVVVNVLILAAAVVFGVLAPRAETAGGTGAKRDRAVDEGPRPQPGRRF